MYFVFNDSDDGVNKQALLTRRHRENNDVIIRRFYIILAVYIMLSSRYEIQ